MATSRRRLVRYLGSTKNLAGSGCGLLGLVLYFAGVAGPYWPFVVAGLYAAGALAAPPERVVLVFDDATTEIDQLRKDLGRLVEEVSEHGARIPPGPLGRLHEIKDMLNDLLSRPDLLSPDMDARYEIARAIRTDLPTGFQTFLNLPRWFATGRGPENRRTAADELTTQLDLITDHITELARRLYETDAQRLRDQTRYLQDRSGSELDPGASD